MSNQQDPLPPSRAVLAIALALAVSTQAARAEPPTIEHDRGSVKAAIVKPKGALHQATPSDPVPVVAPVVAPIVAPLPVATPAPPPKPADPLATPSKMVEHPDKMAVETVARAGRRLVAGGADGLIILSDDSGATWRQVQLPVATTVTGIRFTDDRTGWAIGQSGAVLRTVDSGEHWTLVFDGVRAAQATLDAARSANAADSIRQKKIDAAQRLVSQDTARPFLLIQAGATGPVRLIGSANLAIATDDAGKSWRPWSDAIENPNGLQVYGLAQRNGITLVAGERGLLLAGKPEDGLRLLKPPFDGTFFGAIDGGPHGLVIFGQQGRVYSVDLSADWVPGKSVNWRRIADPSPPR
ncbi:MAG: WD40/YVTN/BNR-like repeat-containing protein [Janthinobacterium lividum]